MTAAVTSAPRGAATSAGRGGTAGPHGCAVRDPRGADAVGTRGLLFVHLRCLWG